MKLNNVFFRGIAIAVIVALHSCTSSTDKDSKSAEVQQNDLPQLVVTKLDGTQLDLRALTGKTVLVLFQTDCDHCQRETAAIQKNISAFKGYSLYFITTSAPQEIEKFANEYMLASEPNVQFCQTTSINILNSFGPIDAPSLYIFSDDHRLVKKFNGETSINEIIRFI